MYRICKDYILKIDNDMQNLINKFRIDITKTLNLRDFERELKHIWVKLKFSYQLQLKGTRKKILLNGKVGFIETENKKTYYSIAKF